MNDAGAASAQDEHRAIRRLLLRLKRSSPVRHIATSLLEQSPLNAPIEDISPLLTAISNPSDKNWKERTVAAWALGQVILDPEQQLIVAQKLGIVLIDQSYPDAHIVIRSIKRVIQYIKRSLWLTIPMTSVLFLATVHREEDDPSLPFLILDLMAGFLLFVMIETLLLFPFLGPFSYGLDQNRANQARCSAAKTLGKLGLPLSIDALARGVFSNDYNVQIIAMSALKKILPKLEPDHYGYWPSSPVPDLCRLLTYLNPNRTLILIVLEALGKIGDGRAIKPVRQLADNTSSKIVKEAALQILPILQERLQQEQNPQMLLRASSNTSPETLLRAVATTHESMEASQLLRAGMDAADH